MFAGQPDLCQNMTCSNKNMSQILPSATLPLLDGIDFIVVIRGAGMVD